VRKRLCLVSGGETKNDDAGFLSLLRG
jgi:hypothetical protein